MAQKETTTMSQKHIQTIFIVTGLILSIPLIAMQFTDEVDWGLHDFIVIGSLLIGTGLLYEYLSHKVVTTFQKGVLAVVLLVALLAVWAELAVGVFGSPFAGS